MPLCGQINITRDVNIKIRNMKGSKTKYYKRPMILDKDQLQYLTRMVEERFGDVKYEVKTNNGDEYDYNSFDELLAYNNPNSRKITTIYIRGNKSKDGFPSLSGLSISIGDMSNDVLSCYMDLRYLDEAEIEYFSNRIDSFVKDNSIVYWWIYKPGIIMVLYCFLCTIVGVCFSLYMNKEYGLDINQNTIWLVCWLVSCMGVTFFLMKNVLGYLFPAGGFLIGEQIKAMDKRRKVRKWILGLITGVISSLIVAKLKWL